MLLAEPGSGPFKGARLEHYERLPDDLNLLVVVGEDDYVVGEEFGRLVFENLRHACQQCHRCGPKRSVPDVMPIRPKVDRKFHNEAIT